jgi:hypothetical protein
VFRLNLEKVSSKSGKKLCFVSTFLPRFSCRDFVTASDPPINCDWECCDASVVDASDGIERLQRSAALGKTGNQGPTQSVLGFKFPFNEIEEKNICP